MKELDTRCPQGSTLPTPACEGSRTVGPRTHFPDAVFAEVFVVAENDDFVGHGCTDVEPILNLKSNQGTRQSQVCILTLQQNQGESISIEHISQPVAQVSVCGEGCSVHYRMVSSNPRLYSLDADG